MDLEAVTSNPPRKERENPVRMRQIDIPTSMTAISAAVVRHAVVGLHLHSGSSHNSSLQFYQQIKHLTEEDDIKWLCFPLHQDETIVEVGVYGPATFGKPYDDSTIVVSSLRVVRYFGAFSHISAAIHLLGETTSSGSIPLSKSAGR